MAPNSEIILDEERSHYLCRVLRARKNEPILCFDGSGVELTATVVRAESRTCRLALGEVARTVAPPRHALHLASAVLKSDLDQVVQKATELGATDLWFIDAQRCEGHALREDRATRIVRSACEQSGRVHLPEVHALVALEAFFDACAAAVKLMLVPGARPLAPSMQPDDFALLVGPEGGWTKTERALAAQRAATEVGLGSLVLRANTAGLAALAALRQSIGWDSMAL